MQDPTSRILLHVATYSNTCITQSAVLLSAPNIRFALITLQLELGFIKALHYEYMYSCTVPRRAYTDYTDCRAVAPVP